MEIKDLQTRETKCVPISIRTYKKYSEFMKQQNISPNAIFNEALKELVAKTKVKK